MNKLVIASALIIAISVLVLVLFIKPSIIKIPTGREAATPEELAISEIEEELNAAVENITMEDIENALLTQE
jgi:hypothetical protein